MDAIYSLFLFKAVKRPMVFLLKQNTLSTFLKVLITLLAAFSLYYTTTYETRLVTKVAVGLMVPFIFFIVAAPSVRNFYHQSDFVGHWEYTNKPDYENKDSGFDQAEEKKRYVQIYRDDGQLRVRASTNPELEGLLCDTSDTVLSGFGTLNGRLMYKYSAPQSAPPKQHFSGFVVLEWQKPTNGDVVKSMSGRYYGLASQSMGAVYFIRITEKQYHDGCKKAKAVEESIEQLAEAI